MPAMGLTGVATWQNQEGHGQQHAHIPDQDLLGAEKDKCFTW